MKLFHYLSTRDRFRHFRKHVRYLVWLHIGYRVKRDIIITVLSLLCGFLIGYAAGMGRTVEDFESCMNRQQGSLSQRVTTCQGYWDREWTKRKEWRQ